MGDCQTRSSTELEARSPHHGPDLCRVLYREVLAVDPGTQHVVSHGEVSALPGPAASPERKPDLLGEIYLCWNTSAGIFTWPFFFCSVLSLSKSSGCFPGSLQIFLHLRLSPVQPDETLGTWDRCPQVGDMTSSGHL